MLGDEIESPGELTADDLRRRYESKVADVIGAAGEATVAERTGLPAETVAAAAEGDAAGLDIEDVAAILAVEDGAPDAETVASDARNQLMLEMSGAALNVDRVALDIDAGLDPKEIQAKMEGRLPMTLDEYAAIRQHVASEADW